MKNDKNQQIFLVTFAFFFCPILVSGLLSFEKKLTKNKSFQTKIIDTNKNNKS